MIHSGLTRRSDSEARERLAALGIACPTKGELDALRGCLIGLVELVDVLPIDDLLHDRRYKKAAASGLAVGPYCWLFARPMRLAKPISYLGRQSLWKVPGRLLRTRGRSR